MLGRLRLRRTHARFLECCRSLHGERAYWDGIGARKGLLQAILPVPLLSLHDGGRELLDALRWLEARCRSVPLREETIRSYHRRSGGDGAYRSGAVAVEGSPLPRTAPHRVAAEMRRLDVRLAREQEALDAAFDPEKALRLAVETYQRIGLVHPFEDGNGRTARLAMNHLLRRYGEPYVILPPLGGNSAHWDAIQEAHRGRPEALADFARRCRVAV